MQIRTLLGYLIGRREAILEIASDRRSLVLGFLFVLSAGLAREYDGADLLHEPWRLVLPLGASLATSFALFVLTFGVAKAKKMPAPPFLDSYLTFLSLFWMTAPLAWLYAIPYERFLGPVEATGANLWTLGLVSVWRVALMIRVVSVLMGYHFFAAFFLVIALADGEALLAFAMSPIPPIELMGGIHGSASEMLRKVTAQNLCFLGTCSFPIWLIGVCVAIVKSHPSWQGLAPTDSQSHPWSWPLAALVCVSLGIWIAILPFTQPEQELGRRVETALKEGRLLFTRPAPTLGTGRSLAIDAASAESLFPVSWRSVLRTPVRAFRSNRITKSRPPVTIIWHQSCPEPMGPHPAWGVATILYAKERCGQIISMANGCHAHGFAGGKFRRSIDDF